MRMPEMAREITRRWISEVRSTMLASDQVTKVRQCLTEL
jgi:hypothetical protein